MKHLFLAIHRPKPAHFDDLIEAMAVLGAALDGVPGLLDVSTWRDQDRVVAMSLWESPEALAAARQVMGAAIAGVPFDEWEGAPPERYLLDEFAIAPTARRAPVRRTADNS